MHLHLSHGGRRGADNDLFSVVTSDRSQGNGLKLSPERFRLDIRTRFFPQKVFEYSNKLPREVATAPSLAQFKKCWWLENLSKDLTPSTENKKRRKFS